jgi:DNA-binding NarL/FixJ family response regulator
MKTMASPQKQSNSQLPSEGTARAVGVLSDSISMLLAGASPEGEVVGIMSPEKQAAVGAGGKDFGLTPREKQVIVLVVAGYTNKDIAHKLGVSEQAIKHHVANIFDKLGVLNRLELSLLALYHRVID